MQSGLCSTLFKTRAKQGIFELRRVSEQKWSSMPGVLVQLFSQHKRQG